MNCLARDLHYAIRRLVKSPAFTLITILTIAFGMAGISAFFSTFDALVLRPLAVPDLNRVVVLSERINSHDMRATYADFAEWQQDNSAFSELAAHRYFDMTLLGSGNPERIRASQTTASLFPLLRAEPWIGRNFRPEENQSGAEFEVILSYPFWRTHFDSDPKVLGRTIQLNSNTYTVIGVMPEGFHYSPTTAVWMHLDVTPQWQTNRTERCFTVVARLRHEITLRQAQEQMNGVAAALARRYPDTNRELGVHVQSISDYLLNGQTHVFFGLIIGVTICLLLVVCTNVANLELSRSLNRRTEIAIQMCMGASRKRILFQLLLENLLLGLAGGILGLAFAWVNLHIIISLLPAKIAAFLPSWNSIGINGRVFFYSLFVAALTGILCGIGPAFAVMRISVFDTLKRGTNFASPDRKSNRQRKIFAASQISFSLALGVVAALMAMSLTSVMRSAERLNPRQVLNFEVVLPQERYGSDTARADFYQETMQRLRSIPGVDSVGIGNALPYGNPGMWGEFLSLPGEPLKDHLRYTQRFLVSPDYLSSFQVQLYAGRMLSESDVLGRQPVAVVNQSFAAQFYPDGNALGKRIHLGDEESSPWITVVGIAGNVPMSWMDHSTQPAVFVSYTQFPQSRTTYVVRVHNDSSLLVAPIRQAIHSVDSALPIESLETYEDYLRDAFIVLRMASGSLIANAAMALFLAMLGIFGVMATLVEERTGEIGLRMALGASRNAILIWILRQSMTLTAAGVLTGIPLAYALSRVVSHFLYTSSSGGLMIFLITPLLIVILVQLTALLPARRAAAVDPARVLRSY